MSFVELCPEGRVREKETSQLVTALANSKEA